MKNQRAVASANRLVTLVILIASILLVIAVSYAFSGTNKSVTKNTSAKFFTTNAENAAGQIADIDTDGDGLADWEELLWETDPNKADTDGDGVSDKEEVAEISKQKNVTSDQLALQTLSKEYSNEEDNKTLTLTDIASRELINSYMSKLRTGTQPTSLEQDQMASDALSAAKSLITVPSYTTGDVHTVATTNENATVYLKGMQNLMTEMTTGVPDDSEILLRIAQGGERSELLPQLKITVDHYKETLEKMQSVSVPVDAVDIHVAFVNALLVYTYNVEGFINMESDPMRTAISLKALQTVRVDVVQTANNLHEYAVKYNF